MAHYVDGIVIQPSKKSVGDYRRMARKARMIDSSKVALLKVADWILHKMSRGPLCSSHIQIELGS